MLGPSSRIDEVELYLIIFLYKQILFLQDTSIQVTTDNECELDISRTTGGNQSDDGRPQQSNNYVTNRVAVQCKF